MLKTIAIDELEPGMFVDQVAKQTGSLKVKSRGWVRTPEMIAHLKAKGILDVTIDTNKQLSKGEEDSELGHDIKMEEPERTSFDQELGNATRLYDQAKGLQQKLLEHVRDGKRIDLEPVRELSTQFIDSVFANQDALACLTRIRDKDAYLLEHSINVSILMSIFAKHLKYDKETVEELAYGGLLHDIGKIKVQEEILHKTGSLDMDEFEVMKQHVLMGKNVLDEHPELSTIIREVMVQHHERLDGKGYPYCLKDEEISRFGRMIAIVDSYDAMTGDRCYRDGMLPIQAFKVLTKESPAKYDAELVQEFIRCMGIHPVGTVVKLKSNKLAMVTQLNPKDPLRPCVKAFYSITGKHHIETKDIDLAAAHVEDEIEMSIKPEDFKINFVRFFKEAIVQG